MPLALKRKEVQINMNGGVLSNLNSGGNPDIDSHPIQGGVEILLVTSC